MPDQNTPGYLQQFYDAYKGRYGEAANTYERFSERVAGEENVRKAVFDDLRKHGDLNDTWNFDGFSGIIAQEYKPSRDQKNKAVIEQNAQTNIQNWQANQQAFPTQPKAAPSTAPAPLDPAKQPVPVEQGGLTEEQKKYYSAQADSLMASNDSAMADFNAFADVAKTPDLSPLKFQPKTNQQIKEEAYMGAWMDSENARKAEAALNAHYQELGMPTKGNTSEIDWDKLEAESVKDMANYNKILEKYRAPGGMAASSTGISLNYMPVYTSGSAQGRREIEEAKRGVEAAQVVKDLAVLNSNLAKGVSGDRRKLYAGWLDEKWEDIATLGITGINRNMALYDIAKRASKGEKLLPVEERALNAMVSNQELSSQLYDSWLASFGAGARGIAEFVAEMRLTGGVGKAVKGTSTIVSKGARKILEGGVKTFAAAGAQALVMPSTYEHMSQNLLGLYDVGISYGPDGKFNTIVERNDKSAGYAAYKALGSQAGMLFGFDTIGQVAKAAPAWIDKLAKTKGWAKPINNVLKWEERMQKSGKWNDRLTSFITKNTGSSAQMSVSMRVANVTSALATGDWEEVKGMLDPKQLSVDLAVGFVFGGLGDVARLANRGIQKWEVHRYNKEQHKAYRTDLQDLEAKTYNTKEADGLRKEFLGVLVKDLDGTQDISKMVERMRQVGGKLETAMKYRGWEYEKLQDELEKGSPTEARRAEIEGRIGELEAEMDDYTNLAYEASRMEQRALYLKGVVEGTALTLEDQIGEFRSRTSPWPAVTVIRDRDTGKDYFLLDDKGEVSVVRGMTRDAQPFDMKNTSYDIVFKVPLEEYVARVGTVGMEIAGEMGAAEGALDRNILERNRLNSIKADMEERGTEEVKPEEAPKAEEIVEEAAAEGEAPLKEGDVAYFEGKPVKIEEVTEDGYAIFEGEDGAPVAVEASRLTREPVVEQAPVAEEAPVAEAPAAGDVVPETAEGQTVAEETAPQEAPLPMTKDGDIDYTTLMDQDPVRFITEMDKATKRPGSGTEFLIRAREKTEQDIAKTQKSLENETDPNKYIKNTRKLEELQAKKEAYEKALKPLEEASDMVDEIVAEQTKGEAPVEEKPAEAVEENQVENPVATPQAEEPVGPTAEEQAATQKQLQDSMDMASKIAGGKTGQIPQPEVNPIQQSMDMASKIARGKTGQVPPAPKVREQRELLPERESLIRRGIRDAVVEKFRQRAGIETIDDGTGQSILDAVNNLVRMHAVWHGGGVKFNKFDFSFMSSGEGAQAFGWGGYVSEVKGIAISYARKSAKEELTDKQKKLLSDAGFPKYKDLIFENDRTSHSLQEAYDDLNALEYLDKLSFEELRDFIAREKRSMRSMEELNAWEFVNGSLGAEYLASRLPNDPNAAETYRELKGRMEARVDNLAEKADKYYQLFEELGEVNDASYLYHIEIPDNNLDKKLAEEQKEWLKQALRDDILKRNQPEPRKERGQQPLGKEEMDWMDKALEDDFNRELSARDAILICRKWGGGDVEETLAERGFRRNYITYGEKLYEAEKQRMREEVEKRMTQKAIDYIIKETGVSEEEARKATEDRRNLLKEDLDDEFGVAIYGEDVIKILEGLGFEADEASKLLSDLGYVGIKYPAQYRSGGREDKASNFVIFKESDMKIKSTIKLFKSKDGRNVYGFTSDGKIYLDPNAPADTPIHEYTHMWAEMFRKVNSKEWKNIVGLMKDVDGGSLWKRVKETYPEIKDENDLAEEALAWFSGARGVQRLREEMERIRGDKSLSSKAKMTAIRALDNLRKGIEKFWKTIAEYLGMEFTTAEEVADRVLADIAKGVNPMKVMERFKESNRQVDKAQQVLDYFTSKGFKDGQIIRSITDNGVSTYIEGSWGLHPYTKYRISDHGVGPYREQREISFNYDTRPETLYRLGAGKRARSGEAQQSKVNGPSEYDRLWDQHKDQVKGLKFSKWQSPMGLEEAMKEKPFIRDAKYLQQRTNKDGTYTYEFSEPGEQTPETRPSIGFLRNMEPERGIRMQKAMDRTEQAVKETGEKIEEAKEIRKAKLDAMDGKIKKVSKTLVKAAQKGYDKATVQTVTDLAKELVKEGMVDNAGRRSIKSILTVMKNVTGKENIEKDVRRLMSIVTENQIRNQQAYMAKLEKIKPVKVNSSGVKVQGRVDLFGARMMDEYKRSRSLSPEKIRQKMAALDTSDEAGKARSAGLELAEQYARLNELEEGYKAQQEEFKKTLKEMWESYRKADGETKKQAFRAYQEFGESGRNSLLDTRLTISDAYGEMNRSLFRDITKGVLGAKSFKSDQLKHKDELLHGAYADNEGTSDFPLHKDKKKTAFDRDVPKFFLTPTTSFDMILRQLGRKSINGEGYTWNHFLRGAVRASGAEFDGIAAAEKEMRAKVQELTGKKNWSDLYGSKETITVDVLFKGKAVPTTITVGNALYIYAANKMEDGRMKLRAMGIDQASIDKMMADVPKEYKKLIDWVQDEFLPKLAKKYAPVYEKLFGASFDMVENYFPLKIAKGDRKDEIDLGNPEAFALPSTMTGALVKRTKNTSMLDVVNADAFDTVLEYVHKMEHWAAYAPLIKDLNILINDTRFKNQVMNMKTIYGSGENLWNEFVKTAEMAVGSFRPAGAKSVVDKTAVNISKGITAAKINLRVFTAIKQLLSTPAYIADANIATLGKNMAKPGAAWNWCMENLPLFRKRWESRIAGETRLLDTEYDWGVLRNDITKGIVRFGITPNAFVDALTVSIGAKSIYETRLKRYLKDGYEKAKAEELAKEDAQILFNETQQSAEGAFLSSIQLDRTWWAASLSVFRNASMGYQRQVFDAARNLKHMGEAGYKKEFLEFETKRRIRQGVSEEDARAGAERLYKRAIRHNAVRLATFGYILPYFWYMGASLPYFLFGKDDEKKGAMEKEARWHALAGIFEGLAGGNVVSDAWNIIANGQKKDWQYWDLPNLPIASDVKNLVVTFANDRVQGMNELINLVVQGGIGINPQSVTDIINATLDATDGDFSKGREALLVALKLAQVPQTRLRELYIDELGLDGEEASKLSISDIARRYAQEQVRRNAFFTRGFYSKEGKAKAENSKMKTFKMRVDERKKLHLDDARAKELGISTRNSAANKTVPQLKTQVEEEAKRLEEALEKMKNK